MAAAPLTVKLRCASWPQLRAIYQRDLGRRALFLKSSRPPPLGTLVQIDLTLPSDSMVVFRGVISSHVAPGELDGRGPGIDIKLDDVPKSALWLIETALRSAAATPEAARPAPGGEGSVEDGAPIADAESELITALQAEFEALRKLNPFQVLGLPYDTNDEAVRAAFGKLTRRYHPDRFARYQSQRARQHASEIFILVRDAYRKLGTEKARTRTHQSLRDGSRTATPTRGVQEPRRPTPPGDPNARKPGASVVPQPKAGPAENPGLTLRPTPGSTAGHRTTGTAAIVFDTPAGPSAGATPISLAPARRSGDPSTYSDAERLIEQGELERAHHIYGAAARRSPGDRHARAGVELVEGLKALAQRDRLEAAQRFEAVLELDPDNERAARELAEMRSIATTERKGLLARLLGKKE